MLCNMKPLKYCSVFLVRLKAPHHTYFNLKYIFTTFMIRVAWWGVGGIANKKGDENLVVLRFTIVRFVIIV